MCFGMHFVDTAVLAAKSTPYHEAEYLEAIGRGEHITTIALSETGPESTFTSLTPNCGSKMGRTF